MFARNVLLAFALCATSTVFAAPISVSTTTSSATITSNTQLLSSTTILAEPPSANTNEYYAQGLGPIFRDGKNVDHERVPAPLGLIRSSTPRDLVAQINKSVVEVQSVTDLGGVVSDARLGDALDNLSPEQLVALLSKLSPQQLRALLSKDAVASLLSKEALDNLFGAAPTTPSVDKEPTAASAVASALTPTKAARGKVLSAAPSLAITGDQLLLAFDRITCKADCTMGDILSQLLFDADLRDAESRMQQAEDDVEFTVAKGLMEVRADMWTVAMLTWHATTL